MADYNEMVQALARARDRSVAEHKRVTDVQAMIVKAIGAELRTTRRVVTTSELVPENHYLHHPAEMTVFTNELALLLQDEDDEAGEPSATLSFAMSYGIMVMSTDEARAASVSVSVNRRSGDSLVVGTYEEAQVVAREIVASCNALLRLGGNARFGAPKIIG